MRSKLIVGLADEAAGNRVWDALQHVTGDDSSLTISPSTVTIGASTASVGVTSGRLGFFGAAVTTKPVGITAGAAGVTALVTALGNLGLIGTTTA
jgi:hypothetical protein